MLHRFFSITLIFLVSNTIFGQKDYYFELSGNYSFIKKNELILESDYSKSVTTEKYTSHPGVNTGVGFNKNLTDKFSINSGIGFSYKGFKTVHREDIEFHRPIQPVDIYIQDTIPEDISFTYLINETKIFYFTIPISLFYSLSQDKLKIGVGLMNYFVAYSNQVNRYFYFQDPSIKKQETDNTSDGINNYQLNGNFSVEYKLFNNIWIKSSFSQGILWIFDKQPETFNEEYGLGNGKYSSLEIGLKYIL